MEKSLTVRQQENIALDKVRSRMMVVEDRLFEGAPRHISAERMRTTTLIAIRDNPELLKCELDSLFGAIRQAAFYGWEIGGPLAQAYLVPFRDTKRGTSEAVLIPGYRGLIDLVRRSGETSQIDMEVVHQADRFKVVKGDASAIFHEPSEHPDRLKSPITHVYVIVHFLNGAKQRGVWTAAEIDWHKEKFSQGWAKAEKNGRKDSPWHTHWKTMAFKTVLIDMVKRGQLPVSGEIRESVQKEEHGLGGMSVITDVRAPLITQDEPARIEDGTKEDDTAMREPADVMAKAKLEIDEAKTINEIAESLLWAEDALNDAGKMELTKYAEVARERVRQARGERSNQKD